MQMFSCHCYKIKLYQPLLLVMIFPSQAKTWHLTGSREVLESMPPLHLLDFACSQLGSPGASLEGSWGLLGRFMGHVWGIWGPFGDVFGPWRGHLEAFWGLRMRRLRQRAPNRDRKRVRNEHQERPRNESETSQKRGPKKMPKRLRNSMQPGPGLEGPRA